VHAGFIGKAGQLCPDTKHPPLGVSQRLSGEMRSRVRFYVNAASSRAQAFSHRRHADALEAVRARTVHPQVISLMMTSTTLRAASHDILLADDGSTRKAAAAMASLKRASSISCRFISKPPFLGKIGHIPLGIGRPRFQTAQRYCQHLLPNFTASLAQCLMTGDCPPAVVQQALTEGLKFAQCMRNQGVPNWPDPTIDSAGRPSFQVTAAGISIDSTRSPQMLSKIGHCQNQPGVALLRQE
jgi:hypothetical protein